MSGVRQVPAGVDPDRPAPARIYDYLLSGENNFPADREAAEKITALVPALLARYLDALAPGSYLALSHLTADHKPPRAVQEFCRVFDHATQQMHFRARPDVERLFTGLDLVPPHHAEAKGRLCYAGDWGAEDLALSDSDGSHWLYCAVARRP